MAGQKINDHASWIGSAPSGMPMPMHTKTKSYTSAEGAGHVGTDYPDTTEAIQRDQSGGISKVKSHSMKTGYRN